MANRYFVGAVDAHWNDVGNWAAASGGPGGASVPIAGDDAIFDGSSPSCNADVNVTPDNIRLVAGFANTLDLVTFNATLAGGISVAAGTMLCGSGNVTALGNVTVTGGTLNGESATIRCYTTWSTGGGTWTAGTSTVQMWADAAHLAQQITGATAFYNLTVGATAPGAGCTLTLTATVTVNGTFDYQGNPSAGFFRFMNGGQIRAAGTVSNSDARTVYGTTLLYINGAVNQAVSYNAGFDLTVNKGGGACRFNSFMVYTGYRAVAISLDASVDWVTLSAAFSIQTYGFGVTITATGGLTAITAPVVYIVRSVYGGANDIDLGGLVVIATGTVTYICEYGGNSRRLNNGRIEVGGNLVVDIVDNGAFTGTAVFRMTGAVNRTISFSGRGQDRYWNPLEIQKTGGASVTLLDALGTRGAGQNLTVTSGVLDLAGFSITVGGTFSVAAGATLRARGDEVITATARTYNAASNVALYNAAVTALLNNLGTAFGNVDLGPPGKLVTTTAGTTITFAGALTSTGTQANPVLIRSTVPGVQCFWTLTATGSSALGAAVDVMDNNAGGGPTIYAIGSADRGNNVNWWFGEVPTFTVPVLAVADDGDGSVTVTGTNNAGQTSRLYYRLTTATARTLHGTTLTGNGTITDLTGLTYGGDYLFMLTPYDAVSGAFGVSSFEFPLTIVNTSATTPTRLVTRKQELVSRKVVSEDRDGTIIQAVYACGVGATRANQDLEAGDTLPDDTTAVIISSQVTKASASAEELIQVTARIPREYS